MSSWLSNLRLRFLFLVVLAVLPAVGLLLITVTEQRDDAVVKARADAQQLARLAAADQGRLIESTRQLLTVLARLPEVKAGGESCNALFADLLIQFPRYTNLGVIAPDGIVSCSGVPAPTSVYLGDRAYFQEAVRTEGFVVGEYQIGRITNRPGLNCGFAILDASGALIGVVYAALDLDSLGQFAAQARLPEGAFLTVLDRSGRVLVRLPKQDEIIGTSLVGTPVVDTILREGTGVTEQRDGDQTYVFAFESLRSAEQGNAFLSIALPKSDVTAPAEKRFGDNLTRLALAVMVILIAAWVGTDLLVRQSPEAHKVLVHRFYDAFSTGGLDLLDEVVADDFVDNDPMPDQPPGLLGLKQAVGSFRSAFPDGEMAVDDLVAEGDRVVARVSMTGTHRGEYGGMPGTGHVVRSEGIEIFRIAKGKIVEGWSRFVLPLALLEINPDILAAHGHEPDAIEAGKAGSARRGPIRTILRGIRRVLRRGGN
jgi:steroid delta-isomerase-like uncharacterized protein